MQTSQAAWVAGIIEGEGCISWNGKGSARIRVKMSDRDVIDQLQAWTGVGSIRTDAPRANRKQIYVWTVDRAEELEVLYADVAPWLMSRRAAKLEEIRALVAEYQAGTEQRAVARAHKGWITRRQNQERATR